MLKGLDKLELVHLDEDIGLSADDLHLLQAGRVWHAWHARAFDHCLGAPPAMAGPSGMAMQCWASANATSVYLMVRSACIRQHYLPPNCFARFHTHWGVAGYLVAVT